MEKIARAFDRERSQMPSSLRGLPRSAQKGLFIRNSTEFYFLQRTGTWLCVMVMVSFTRNAASASQKREPRLGGFRGFFERPLGEAAAGPLRPKGASATPA